MNHSATVPVERIRRNVRCTAGPVCRLYTSCTCHDVSGDGGAATLPDMKHVVAPAELSVGSGLEEASESTAAQFAGVSLSGLTPSMGEAACVAFAPSSIGQ